MRKLKLQMQISVDGLVAGPNGEMDWMTFNWDDELKNYISQLTSPVDTIILGRNLATGFIPTWKSRAADPETADDFAHKMVNTAKVVFSKTLENTEWENTALAKGDLAQEINRLKEQPGQDMIVYGGEKFVSSLIKEGLIDEYHLFVNPAILGKGLAIFTEAETRQNLQLIESKGFACGVVVLAYAPKQEK